MKIRHMSKKMDILGCYLPNYKEAFTGRELAEKIHVSPQSALNTLNELIRDGAITFSKQGRNKRYTLKLEELSSAIHIQLAEHYRSMSLLHNAELRIILEELLAYAKTIILFGSFAKGVQKEDSDVDIILIGQANREEIRKIVGRAPRKISIEYTSLAQFTRALKNRNALAVELLKNHAVYGDADLITDIFIKHYDQRL